ncbi:MAG: ASKHA domain-containing protein [Lachnospiraceae bacterium]|nr:ASKHA domain-containing protein [Lachnospiraceae bacterium]
MSEIMKITILIEKENGIQQKAEVTQELGATLLSTLRKMNLISESFCGGIGKCGRCRVQFIEGAPIPTAVERSQFSPDELREGYRLACMVRPKNSCVIRLAWKESYQMDIITDVMKMSQENDLIGQHEKTAYEDQKAVSHQEEAEHTKACCPVCLVAVDLGTTTIAMQLRELSSGRVISSYCETNPQRCYGADVLSRIQAAGQGHAEEMKESVWQVIRRGMKQFTRSIVCISIAGNTTMEHLLMGLPTESLGISPFTPVEIGLQETQFEGIPVYVMPGISTFVGGDIVAGLYYTGLLKFAGNASVLFLDLGTNGEMALTDGKRMLVTATAAGPAFEGGAGAAVPGSDMIALMASFLRDGIMDETGLLAEPYFTEGIRVFPDKDSNPEKSIFVTQQDIRALQMAKAAVRAGVEILWKKMGCPVIEQVYLAGGFGYYLDVKAAIAIGLLPKEMCGNVKAVGNTSLAGAYQIGKDLYCGRTDKKREMESVLQKLCTRELPIESINLAKQEHFEERYLRNLNFGL